MGQIFDFSEIEKSEKTIRKTWSEFREALASGSFTYDEIEKAKKCTFLKVYDDLFNQHLGINHKTITIKELDGLLVGRGTILSESEVPNYERFIPKKEFIKNDNRFSPPGLEWLYLAVGNEDDIHQCSQAECRAEKGKRFGFCHFIFDDSCLDLKLVDLSIADDISYDELNSRLENYGQKQVKKSIRVAKALGFIPKYNVNADEFKRLFTEWGVYTHTKLLSEQIFEPLCDTDDKSIMYAPFQTMAQYYISLGYSGIIYGSTVSSVGRNIVLFDKKIARPSGVIEDYVL
ncbi:MAG: RES family NAD+ phosphorylase [Clostridium sp.]|nr:RES family NAD+ phosphorylase [Clostridium sp.]